MRLTCDSWEDTQAVVLLILVGTLRKVLKRGVNRQALFAERVEDAIHIQHHERFHSSCRCHVPAGAQRCHPCCSVGFAAAYDHAVNRRYKVL